MDKFPYDAECKRDGVQFMELSLLPNSKTIDRVITTIKMKSRFYVNKIA